MHRLTAGLAVALLALTLAACGESPAPPASGPVGRWEVDADRFWDALVSPQIAEVLERQRKALAAAPAEQRDLLAAIQRTGPELKAILIEYRKKQLGAIDKRIELRADHSMTMNFVGLGTGDSATGTWAESGGTITMSIRTQNGQPVAPGDSLPQMGQLRDGFLLIPGDGARPDFWMKRQK